MGDASENKKEPRGRVEKTVLPSELGGGPCGLGDPEDKSIKKRELALIDKLVKKNIWYVKCNKELEAVNDCVKAKGYGWWIGQCRDFDKAYKDCWRRWIADEGLRKELTEEYIEQRSQYRLTGRSLNERKLDEYRWADYLRREKEGKKE